MIRVRLRYPIDPWRLTLFAAVYVGVAVGHFVVDHVFTAMMMIILTTYGGGV